MYDEVVARLMALGLTPGTTDADKAAIQYAIDRAEQWIKNNINQPTVPPGLHFVWVDMAAGLYFNEQKALGTDGGTADAAGAVESIKEGDTTVTFATAASVAGQTPQARLDALIARMINPPQEQLAAFRRMRW
jgi:hypothetical protein